MNNHFVSFPKLGLAIMVGLVGIVLISTPALAHKKFDYKMLPGGSCKLKPMPVHDTKLCLKADLNNPEAQSCLNGGKNLAIGESLVCWNAGKARFTATNATARKAGRVSNRQVDGALNCVKHHESVKLMAGKIICVATPAGITKVAMHSQNSGGKEAIHIHHPSPYNPTTQRPQI